MIENPTEHTKAAKHPRANVPDVGFSTLAMLISQRKLCPQF
jgi:hypothetical protein